MSPQAFDSRPQPTEAGMGRRFSDLVPNRTGHPGVLDPTQRALLNILEDSEAEKASLKGAQRAFLNILEDSDAEQANLHGAQRAVLNILEDFDSERSRVEVINLQLQEQIAQRLEAAEEIKELNLELERRVTERTAELVASNQELARSNADLERFAFVASHDLQEPLRMVASYTQLLARRYSSRLDADADEFIGYAVDGARRMQTLITDLLDYSRVGTRGKKFGPTDCEAVLEAALMNLKNTIEETGAVLTHDPLPTVQADETQLARLFQNLVGNALKFRGSAPPRVHISARKLDGEWRFTVRDNGIGIDPQYAERIFVIFQRLHTIAQYPGTGMGLAISKRIIERHGGRIWVDSQPGKGTTFYFTIPIREEADGKP